MKEREKKKRESLQFVVLQFYILRILKQMHFLQISQCLKGISKYKKQQPSYSNIFLLFRKYLLLFLKQKRFCLYSGCCMSKMMFTYGIKIAAWFNEIHLCGSMPKQQPIKGIRTKINCRPPLKAQACKVAIMVDSAKIELKFGNIIFKVYVTLLYVTL